MLDSMDEELLCVVRGLVQGVGFRWFVRQQATRRSLAGWVRNNADGSVELVAQGPRDQLESFLEALRRGPRSAMVREVSLEWTIPSTVFHSFDIR